MATTEKGHLLVFVMVPDEDWAPPPPGMSSDMTPQLVDYHFDTVVEVIDPVRGVLLASARYPTSLSANVRETRNP